MKIYLAGFNNNRNIPFLDEVKVKAFVKEMNKRNKELLLYAKETKAIWTPVGHNIRERKWSYMEWEIYDDYTVEEMTRKFPMMVEPKLEEISGSKK